MKKIYYSTNSLNNYYPMTCILIIIITVRHLSYMHILTVLLEINCRSHLLSFVIFGDCLKFPHVSWLNGLINSICLQLKGEGEQCLPVHEVMCLSVTKISYKLLSKFYWSLQRAVTGFPYFIDWLLDQPFWDDSHSQPPLKKTQKCL